MKSKTVNLYLSALAGALLLTACGGGGGGDVSSTGAPAVSAGGSIGGVVTKGIVANAIVTAYCGNSEATADQLAAGVSDAAGRYSLSWTTACAKPIKLVVTAGPTTTMADEATGTNVTPPAGFKLSALVADPDTTAIKNITPLTDMAAAIAGTSATLSKEAVSNAETAIINTVLGGDIGAYQATPLAPTAAVMASASADENKLATLLTAISAFAQDDAICKLQATLGEQIKCATDTFAAQAKATVTGVSDTGYTVATTLPASTPATMLANTLTKIQAESASGTTSGIITATGPQALSSSITSGSSGSVALLMSAQASVLAAANSGGFVPVAATYGIQAARDLFDSLKNDLLALSDGTSTATVTGAGFLDQKFSAMEADWTNTTNLGVSGFSKNLDALKRAVELSRGPFPISLAPLAANTVYPFGEIALVTDSTGAPDRYLRSFTDGMNCYVRFSEVGLGKAGCYYGYGQPNVPLTPPFTGYHHAVEVTESTTASGTYSWRDYLASRTYTATLYSNPSFYLINGNGKYVRTADPAVVTSTERTGTVVAKWNSVGEISAATINGSIQPLVAGQDYSTLDISGEFGSIVGSAEVVSLSGAVTNVKGGVTTLSMAIGSGSQVVHTIPSFPGGPDHPISGKFIVQVKTTAFQYDGTFIANAYTATPPFGQFEPANGSFSGKISTLANGVPTEFLSGTLGATMGNLSTYDWSQPTSATNFLKETVTFSGKATNGGNTYELTAIADGSTYGQGSITLNYSRAGSQMVSVTGTHTDATNTTVVSIKGTGDVNAVLTDGIGDVYTGTTKVGSITKNPSQLNFTDGTYLLLGI